MLPASGLCPVYGWAAYCVFLTGCNLLRKHNGRIRISGEDGSRKHDRILPDIKCTIIAHHSFMLFFLESFFFRRRSKYGIIRPDIRPDPSGADSSSTKLEDNLNIMKSFLQITQVHRKLKQLLCQEVMENMLAGTSYHVEVYIYNCKIISSGKSLLIYCARKKKLNILYVFCHLNEE